MALKSQTKGTPQFKRRQQRVRLRKESRQAFDPLGNPYRSQGDFDRAVTLQARAGYQPQLGEIRAQGSEEERKHTTRLGEVENLYNSYGNELQRSFDQTSGALNNLVAMQQGASSADQAALRAALGASQGQQEQLAQTVGAGSAVPSSAGSSATLLPAYGTAEAARTGLGSSVASAIAEAAQRRSLPALGKIRAGEDESLRHFGVFKDLNAKRANVKAQIPSMRATARKELLGEAREGQNLKFQQGLAGKQFNLETRKQGLAERQQHHQERMDRQNLQLQQDSLDAQIDNASTTEGASEAEARAKAFSSAGSWLDRYTTPSKGEEKHPARYTRDPAHAYHTLIAKYGLNDHDATVLLGLVNDPLFRRWVSNKRRGIQGPIDTRSPAEKKKQARK